MKHITADEEIHISHWTYALDGRALVIIYERDRKHERYVKFLRPTPQLDEYLVNHLQERVSVSALNAVGANWVDEDPFFETGVEVPVEVDDEVVRYCAQNGIAVSEYLYGFSCFCCNPANKEYILEFLPSVIRQAANESCQAAHNEEDTKVR